MTWNEWSAEFGRHHSSLTWFTTCQAHIPQSRKSKLSINMTSLKRLNRQFFVEFIFLWCNSKHCNRHKNYDQNRSRLFPERRHFVYDGIITRLPACYCSHGWHKCSRNVPENPYPVLFFPFHLIMLIWKRVWMFTKINQTKRNLEKVISKYHSIFLIRIVINTKDFIPDLKRRFLVIHPGNCTPSIIMII